MTHQNDSNLVTAILQLLDQYGHEAFAEAYRLLLNEAMKIERSNALAADPYERTEERLGYANGFKPKTVDTRLGKITFQIPQVRGPVAFYPSALEKGIRSERALKLAIAEMYFQGVSTRKVTEVFKELCGLHVTSSQVSRATQLLSEELNNWRSRPLGSFPYLILDARYEKVRHNGTVISCAVLIAIGINQEGKRSVLGVSCDLSEAEIHWRNFLTQLQDRGLHGVKLIISDDHPGLKAARTTRFPSVPSQRCQFHFQRNAQAFATRLDQRAQIARDIRAIFNSNDRQEADEKLKRTIAKWSKDNPKLARWLEENAPETLTVFAFPELHRRRLRTTNALERLNLEIKRRTRVVTIFPNVEALERLVTALLMETSEEWETGKIYLNLKN